MSKETFFKDMNAHATRAGIALSMPKDVILAQWAHESAYGGSSLARTALNFAGIKYNKHADFKSGAYAGYYSISAFTTDYIRVMSLSYYDEVRNAGTVKETIEALGRSPYAEDSGYASKLLKMLDVSNSDPMDSISFSPGSMLGLATSPLVIVGIAAYIIFRR